MGVHGGRGTRVVGSCENEEPDNAFKSLLVSRSFDQSEIGGQSEVD